MSFGMHAMLIGNMILTIHSIEEFLFNPVKLGIFLVILSLIGYIVFVKIFRFSDNIWKKTEFILLVLSALGIGGMVESNRHFFYEREQRTIGYTIDTYIHLFNIELNPKRYDITFSVTPYSPKNIQEIEDDYRAMHLWVLENKPRFIQHVNERKALNVDSIVYPQILAADFLTKDIERFDTLVSEYNKLVDEYNYYANNKGANDIELSYSILYPFFFVLGLSYSIVKYVGEYCNSKKRSKH